jgi:glycosyltransferase involved in cell wall biosynthesis
MNASSPSLHRQLPRVLAILPGLYPSTVISVVKPLIALHQAGQLRAQIALELLARPRDIERADIVIFCRNIEPRYAGLLDTVRRLGRPYIYDLDDNFFEVPLTLEAGRYLRDPARQAQLRAYLAGAGLVRVYAEPVRQRVLPINPRIEKVLPSLDWSLIPAQLPPKAGQPVRLVYATSRLEDELAGVISADLHALLRDYPDRVELAFWGHHPAEFRGQPQVRFLPLVPDYDRFMRQLALAGFDIGLAPLLNDEFHRSKTNNKFREYGACQIAGVYSNVEVYASCVSHGETGLLVENQPGAWRAALGRLVDEAALRRQIQVRAQAYVRAHYSQTQTEQVWLRQIRQACEAQPVAAETAPPTPAGPVALAGRPLTMALAAEMSRYGLRLLRRIRRIGLRPALVGAYRYVDSLRQLRRYNRQLSVPQGPK